MRPRPLTRILYTLVLAGALYLGGCGDDGSAPVVDTSTNSGTTSATNNGTTATNAGTSTNNTTTSTNSSTTGTNNSTTSTNNATTSTNNSTTSTNNNTTPGDTEAPTVAFDAPDDDGVYPFGEVEVELSADDNVGVTEIVLSIDGAPATTLREAPYAWTWNAQNAAEGEHTLTATASDAAGNTAEASVTITLESSNAAPTIAWTSPEDGALLRSIALLAVDAEDDNGVERVTFRVDGELIDTVEEAPFETEWVLEGVEDGEHTLVATARDADGEEAEAEITVTVDQTAPDVTIVAPEPDARLGDAVDVELDFGGADDIASVRVNIADAGVSLTEPPWDMVALDLTDVESGPQELTVEVLDEAGNRTLIGQDHVVDRAPTVAFIAPIADAVVPGPMRILVDAQDDLELASVEVFAGDVSLGAPGDDGGVDWMPEYAVAEVELRAVAIDSAGQQAEVAQTVTVDHPVEVELQQCVRGRCEPIVPGAQVRGNVRLRVEARDDAGPIQDVTIFAGDVLVGTVTEAPFDLVWDSRGELGDVELAAVATASDASTGQALASVEVISCDVDGDTFEAEECGGDDCNDDLAEVAPGAAEICDELDNNCDGRVDEDEGDCIGVRICLSGVCVRPTFCEAVGDACDERTAPTDEFACVAADTRDLSALSCVQRCDPEQFNQDCDPGTFCAEDEDSGLFVCLPSNCTSPLDSIQECVNVGENGGTCFLQGNDAAYCFEAGAVQPGDPCEENTDCEAGLTCIGDRCTAFCDVTGDGGECADQPGTTCVDTFGLGDVGTCGTACAGFDAFDECPDGQGCFPLLPDEGICVDVGEQRIGESCDFEDNTCGAFSTCTSISNALPESAQRCVGWCDRTQPDRGDQECDVEQICVGFGGNYPHLGGCFDGCTPFDGPTGGCDEGGIQTCLPSEQLGRGLCVESGDVPEGEACELIEGSSLADCAPGTVCITPGDEFERGTCEKLCPSFSDQDGINNGCAPGADCILFNAYAGVCRTDATLTPRRGHLEDCAGSAGQWCDEDVFCFSTGGNPGSGTCLDLCRVEVGDSDCPPGNTCDPSVFNDGSLGVCLP